MPQVKLCVVLSVILSYQLLIIESKAIPGTSTDIAERALEYLNSEEWPKLIENVASNFSPLLDTSKNLGSTVLELLNGVKGVEYFKNLLGVETEPELEPLLRVSVRENYVDVDETEEELEEQSEEKSEEESERSEKKLKEESEEELEEQSEEKLKEESEEELEEQSEETEELDVSHVNFRQLSLASGSMFQMLMVLFKVLKAILDKLL